MYLILILSGVNTYYTKNSDTLLDRQRIILMQFIYKIFYKIHI